MTNLRAYNGNYYYGARYYDPKVSVWLSVDPLAHKYPSMSPFIFTDNNPVMLVDPDGNWPNLATLSSWYTSVFNSAAKQTAQHRFNEMKDRTAAARGYSGNIRLASDQSFSVTGSSMSSKIQLADGRAFDQVKGSAGYNILGSKGTASFYGHRKNSLKLYDVTTIDWNSGREGRGVSGGGMGGYGFEVTLKNSNNTVASMFLGKQEFNDLYNNYNSAVDNQFNELLESIPMVKDYYNNVYGAESKMREFWSNTSDWTPEARSTYQQLTQEYNQALHVFNEGWNQ